MTNLCCSEMMSGPRDRPSEGVPRGTSLFAWGDTPFSGHCSSRQGRRAASRLERAEVQQAPLHGGTGRRAPLRRSRSRDNVASSPSRARTRIGCSCLAFFAVGASSADVARIAFFFVVYRYPPRFPHTVRRPGATLTRLTLGVGAPIHNEKRGAAFFLQFCAPFKIGHIADIDSKKRFPSPRLLHSGLSLPVLLACICRSIRCQRVVPIGSSSEFPSLALCSCRAM